MKHQYLFILESDSDLGEIDNPEMEINKSDFNPVKCYGKMDCETFEREWNKGTALIHQDEEVKHDFFNAFKPIMDSMVAQGIIITNQDGTYSQRPSSKSIFVNLVIDTINHLLTNFKVEEEMKSLNFKQSKAMLDKHESRWNNFELTEKDYLNHKQIVDDYEPSFINSLKGQMALKSVTSVIPMISEVVKGDEPEPDIRLDPVQFFECVQHLSNFFTKYADRIIQTSPDVGLLFKSMNIPLPKLTEAMPKVVKLQ